MPSQFKVPEETIRHVAERRLSPRAYSPYLEPIHGKHVIGVNNAYQIGMWLDVLFFGDNSWFLVHRREIAKWPKLKITCSPRFENTRRIYEGIKYVAKDHNHRQGISMNRTCISWNNNSGAASINLAVHFGVKRIILLGFDMCMVGAVSHWHGSHGSNRPRPPFTRHLKGFPQIAKDAKAIGVEILNASPNSAIRQFPRVNVRDLL